MSEDTDAAPIRQYRFRPPPGACDMLLIRHGESQPAVPGEAFPTVGRHADPPLDVVGHAEAERVADRLAGEEISAIYSSGLTRTNQTAAPLAARLGLEVREEHDLREVYLGEWEGGVFRQRTRDGDPLVAELFATGEWAVIPGAEPMAELTERVERGLVRIADAHPDERVVVVVHGGVIAAAMHVVTRSLPLAFMGADNASLTHVVRVGDRWVLRRFNDTGHLATDLDKPVQPLT